LVEKTWGGKGGRKDKIDICPVREEREKFPLFAQSGGKGGEEPREKCPPSNLRRGKRAKDFSSIMKENQG